MIAGWLSVAQKAERLGMSPGHVRRLCPAWCAVGKAEVVKNGRTRSSYRIDPDVLPPSGLSTPIRSDRMIPVQSDSIILIIPPGSETAIRTLFGGPFKDG